MTTESALPSFEERPAIDRQWPLVGREEPVHRVFGSIANSPTSAVVVHGAAGIGSSRVVAEASARLEDAGWAIFRITGDPGMSGVPLAALAALFAGDRPDLETITRDPFALFEYTSARVAAVADGRRAVVVVDDVGLVDSLSLSVIGQLVRSRAVKLVVTARVGDPLPEAIIAMWSGDAAIRIDLHPLTSADIARLLRTQLGGQVPERTIAALQQASGGNPLFLRELVVGAVHSGDLSNATGSWQLLRDPTATRALHELLQGRLRTDAEGRDVIERLAVCGPLPLDELRADGARAAVGRLETAGTIALHETPRGLVVALAHPQYRAAASASISRLRQIDVLLEQAEILEARADAAGTDHTRDDDVRIARWRLDAGRPSHPALLLAGARLARMGNDLTETERLARAAIAAGANDSSAHLLLADVLRTLGRTDEALQQLERARAVVSEAAPSEHGGLLIAIAMLEAMLRGDQPMGWGVGLEGLDDAVARMPEAAGQLALPRATLLLYAEEPAAAIAALGPDPGPESGLQRVAWAAAASIPLAAMGRDTEARAAAALFLEHAETAADPIIPLRTALFLTAQVLTYGGDLDEAMRRALASLQRAIADDDEVSTRHAEFSFGHVYLEMGRLQSSIRWFRDVVSGAEAHGPASFRGPALGALAQLHTWRGEREAAEATLTRLTPELRRWDASSRVARAWLDTEPGDDGAAAQALIVASARYRDSGYVYLESWLLLNAARLGAGEAAAPRLVELAASGDSPLIARRAQHVAALVSGVPEELAAIGELWRGSGALLLAAEAFAGASRAAMESDDPRGAAAWARTSGELADRCEGADLPGLRVGSVADQLTAREREIAVLAAAGESSQGIATRLYLSIRTVDNHLQAAYRKLGIAGRGELAGVL